MSKRTWPGFIPTLRRFLLGSVKPPKAKRSGETSTPTTSTYYEGIDTDYRWFRQDELVRKCLITNTYFATMTAGFEIVLNQHEEPMWLLSLQSTKLKPTIDENWQLTGYRYEGRDQFYTPDEVLYLVNLPLESDRESLSDVKPIKDICRARHELLRENFPEIIRTTWAPYVILQADTSMLSK